MRAASKLRKGIDRRFSLKWRLAKSQVSLLRGQLFQNSTQAPKKAVRWIRTYENTGGGIRVRSGQTESYPEVTGYLIPTLLQWGEQELACRLADWLVRIQNEDGSFPSPDGMPYVFDTAQVLRGLLATADLLPSARNGARKCIDYLFSRLKLGQNGFDIDSIWLERFSDAIPLSSHLYALPPLYGAADVLQHAQLKQAVENCANYYIGLEECLQLTALTHFLAYELEALIDLGKISLARQVLDKLREEQKTDGSVRALEGVNWVCAPGLAQLAVCWYKIGDKHPADQAVGWLERHQMPSGGFLGSYGRGATYFPDSELSWAVKFYLDAKFLQQRS